MSEDNDFRAPTRAEVREERQREHNVKSKRVAKMIGENLLSYICIMVPLLLIGFIWTDSGFPTFQWTVLSDALITIMLFCVAEDAAAKLGLDGGKLDDEYITLHGEYLKMRQTIYEIGIMLLDPFCLWQIDVEFEAHLKRKCKMIGISYEEYEAKYKNMSLKELKDELGAQKASLVAALNQAKPIELTADMLLTDGRVTATRGGLPISGEEYYDKKTKSVQHFIVAGLSSLVTIFFTISMADDISFATVLFTLCKLVVLVYRMYKGYANGAKAYNTVELKHLTAKIKYFYIYEEYIDKKTYLKFGDKYGDVSVVGEE